MRLDELIPANDITLVIVKPSNLDSNARGRLRQTDKEHDLTALRRLLPNPAK